MRMPEIAKGGRVGWRGAEPLQHPHVEVIEVDQRRRPWGRDREGTEPGCRGSPESTEGSV